MRDRCPGEINSCKDVDGESLVTRGSLDSLDIKVYIGDDCGCYRGRVESVGSGERAVKGWGVLEDVSEVDVSLNNALFGFVVE